MVTKNIVKQPKAIVEVSVTVPWEDIQNKWNEVLQKLSSDLELPGFRKGQVPLQMAEQNLGQKLQDEFLKAVMPQALVDALQGSNIVPIDYPKYQLVSFSKGQPISFTATVTERPAVTVTDYHNIAVTRPPQKTITDEDVNKIIDDLFKRWKARGGTPAPAAQQPGGDGSQTTPGAGGSLTFNQPASPAPAVNDISASAAASADRPDDNFAKAMGAQNLVDLKAKIKADLENEAKYNNELDYEELILQEVEKLTTVDIPEILIEDELSRMLVQLQRRVSDMGLLFDEYLKSQNKTLDGLKAEWKPQAEKNVRMELGLADIARQEKIDIAEAELQVEIDKIQDAKLRAQFEQQEPRLHLRHSLRQIRTLDFLKTITKTA
ncbi:MAG: trigger factor [bacterium]|nr:trigger factor [bacterium]